MEDDLDIYFTITERIHPILKDYGIKGDDVYECAGDIYRAIKDKLLPNNL